MNRCLAWETDQEQPHVPTVETVKKVKSTATSVRETTTLPRTIENILITVIMQVIRLLKLLPLKQLKATATKWMTPLLPLFHCKHQNKIPHSQDAKNCKIEANQQSARTRTLHDYIHQLVVSSSVVLECVPSYKIIKNKNLITFIYFSY